VTRLEERGLPPAGVEEGGWPGEPAQWQGGVKGVVGDEFALKARVNFRSRQNQKKGRMRVVSTK